MLYLLVATACTTGDAPTTTGLDSEDTGDTSQEWAPHPGGEIEFTAEDGGVLAGDFYPSSRKDSDSLILYGTIWDTRDTVSPSFLEAATQQGWNVLVMDWRGYGGSSQADPDYENRLFDVESAIRFVQTNSGDGSIAVMGGEGMCGSGLYHAYKAETLNDRTQIAAYGLLPFVDQVCDVLNPDQMPHIPAIWVIDGRYPATAYEGAERENWVFLKDWEGQIGWDRLDDSSYDDGTALTEALIDFYADVFNGKYD